MLVPIAGGGDVGALTARRLSRKGNGIPIAGKDEERRHRRRGACCSG